MSLHPPRGARRLLERLLPDGEAEFVLGDLEEEFREIAAKRPRSARRWYWVQSLRLGGRSAVERLLARIPRKRAGRDRRDNHDKRSEGFMSDLKYAVRSLVHRPGLIVAAVATIAVGVGASTAIFSLVDAVLVEPLPYAEPDRLALVWLTIEERPNERGWLAGPEVAYIREHATSVEEIAALWPETYTLTGDGPPEQLLGGDVTGSLFRILGRGAAVGRALRLEDSEPGAESVVALSDEFWRRRYGADPAALGSSIVLDGASYTVVGIMPAGFRLLTPEEGLFHARPDVWVPLKSEDWANPGNHSLIGLARLRAGADWGDAEQELAALGARYGVEYGRRGSYRFTPVSLLDDLVEEVRPALLVLLGGVFLVLAIVCVNVANMLLARATTRRAELAVRSALGAGRGRIARQLLAESLLLALVGGAAGVALGVWGMGALTALAPENVPRVTEAELNLPVLVFSLAVSSVAGVLFGLAPVREAVRLRLVETLKEGGWHSVGPGGSGRLRSGLVVAQVAFAFVLLIGAGLMVRSLIAMHRFDPGFEPEGVLTAQLSLPRSSYPDEAARRALLLPVLAALREQPGVLAVGAVSELPYSEDYRGGTVLLYGDDPGGREMVKIEADLRSVSDGYFRGMGAELIAGRSFGPQDREGVPRVVVIDRSLAESRFPGEDPVGRRIDFGSDWDSPSEIIGVVEHISHYGPHVQGRPQVYFSYRQRAASTMTLVLKVEGDPAAATEMIRRAVLDADPNQPITRVVPMQVLVDRVTAPDRFYLALLTLFAGIALVLAALGIYALIAQSVTGRMKEIGVRMVLGAGRGSVQWLFVSRAMRLALLGAAIGIGGALALSRFVAALIYDVSPADPVTLVAVFIVLIAVATLAAYVPARSAATADPARTLRDQ